MNDNFERHAKLLIETRKTMRQCFPDMPTDLKVELKKMVEDRMKPVRRSVSPRWMQYPYTIASWRPPVGLALASGLFICAMFWTNKWFIGKISMALVRCRHSQSVAVRAELAHDLWADNDGKDHDR
jgi:hypothetical protein